MQRSHAHFLLAFVLCVACLSGCVTSALLRPVPQKELHTDETAMQAEVLRFVAIGTPIEEAKKIMERDGFECDFYIDGQRYICWDVQVQLEASSEAHLVCSKCRLLENLGTTELCEKVEVIFTVWDSKITDARVKRILPVLSPFSPTSIAASPP